MAHSKQNSEELMEDSPLTGKQRLFVEYFCATLNQTRSMQLAGYEGDETALAAHGSRLVRIGKVARALEKKLVGSTMSAAEILARLTDIARADIGLAITESGDIDIKQIKRAGKSHLVKKYKNRTYTRMDQDGNEQVVTETELELHDPIEALKYMGKFHGLVYNRLKIEIDWEKQAIQSIQAGQLTYAALADLFDKEKAAQLFLAAGVSVVQSPADTVEGEYSELESIDTDASTTAGQDGLPDPPA